MLNSLIPIAKRGIEISSHGLEITSNNIANQMTPGYKRDTISFQTVFNRVLRSAMGPADNQGGVNPIQMGQGVSTAGTALDFTQGNVVEAGPLSLAINGQGLFILSSDGGSSYEYTRDGNFQVNALNNNLVTDTGKTVYGFKLDESGISQAGLTAINLTDPTGNLYTNVHWQTTDDSGILLGTDSSGTEKPIYQIALTLFSNPGGLLGVSGNAYRETLASGQPLEPTTPNNIVGTTPGAMIEESNVVYLSEIILALDYENMLNSNLSVARMASQIVKDFIDRI